ncbi:MAG: tRNA dihydrouridine synthase [Kiritimatiellia bacterium]
MPPRLILAPLRGVTVKPFRNTLAAHFRGYCEALAPFIPTVAGERVKPALLADISGEQAIPLVPQTIGKDPAQLRSFIAAVQTLGYTRCDLNAGCPFPFVAKKGRGSGLLANPDLLDTLFDAACQTGIAFSVKVRLGLRDARLLPECLPILNRYPLHSICIHPRTAAQMYDGQVDLQTLSDLLPAIKHPVIYSGDIRNPADLVRLQMRFPTIQSWMIGRAAAANPFLAETLSFGTDTRNPERLKAFLDDLLQVYSSTLQGNAPVGRFKELWNYLRESLADGDRIWNSLKLCRSLDEYRRVADAAFAPFRGFRDLPSTLP